MDNMSFEVEYTPEDTEVLHRARLAWLADADQQESARGWRRAELLHPDQYLLYPWSKLLGAGVLEYREDTFSDHRITLLGLETLKAIEGTDTFPRKGEIPPDDTGWAAAEKQRVAERFEKAFASVNGYYPTSEPSVWQAERRSTKHLERNPRKCGLRRHRHGADYSG